MRIRRGKIEDRHIISSIPWPSPTGGKTRGETENQSLSDIPGATGIPWNRKA